jgi:hypothetical protein
VALTDEFPIMSDDHRPLGGVWWLEGTELITLVNGVEQRGSFMGYQMRLRLRARQISGKEKPPPQ